jgi:inner membrane protein
MGGAARTAFVFDACGTGTVPARVIAMDPITHTLTGYCLSQAGFNRKTRNATVTLLVAANLPDIDAVSRLGGSLAYLEYHRGPTHSLVGITVLAALTAAVVYALRKDAPPGRNSPPLSAKWLFLGCWAATASHLLLDLTNSYGVRLFWPWSNRWYAADIESMVDPVLLALLIAALGFPALLRLISEEVGARKSGMQQGAVVALGLMAALWGLRYVTHERALTALSSRTYHGEDAVEVAAFPTPANPFVWTGVAETQSAIEVLPVNAINGGLDTESELVFYKPKPSPALGAALKTRTLKVFMSFARFPWAQVEPWGSGWRVTVRDLRYATPGSSRARMIARIRLDKNLGVLSQTLRLM